MNQVSASRRLRYCLQSQLRRWLATLSASLALATPSLASLWQSENWALTGSGQGEVGYDSNLTASKDGPSDVYAMAKPVLTFLRRNSTTDFHLDGGLARTEFLGNKLPAQTDVDLDLVCAYPQPDSSAIPIYKFQASWVKSAQPNQYLGARVKNTQFDSSAEGYLRLTGKLGLRSTAGYYECNYKRPELNCNNRANGFIGLAYAYLDNTEFSVNVGYARGRSIPNDPARTISDVRSNEYYVTAKVIGQITAKIAGSAYGGYGLVDFEGGFSKHRQLPVAGADLTWGIDPRRTVVLAAYSGVLFAPDGLSVRSTNVFLSYTHVIVDHWQYIIRSGPSFFTVQRTATERSDTSWDGELQFNYNPSDRFQVNTGIRITNQSSTIDQYAFGRTLVSIGAIYHF